MVAPELDDLGAAVVGSYLGSRGSWGGAGWGGSAWGSSDWADLGGRGFWVD